MSEEPIGPLLARRWVFRGSDGVIAARPALTLTVYFDDARAWAATHAPALLALVLERWGGSLRWFATSREARWREIPEDPRELVDGLRWEGRPRHQLRFEVGDRCDAPRHGLRYREVDPSRTGQCGYAQVVLPLEAPSDDLLALAIELCQTTPITCAIGGLSFLTSRRYPRQAFDVAFRASKRFLGIDVTEPDAASRVASRALPSVGWLTYVGDALLERAGFPPDALASPPCCERGVSRIRARAGVLLRAGDAPDPGDVNLMEYPRALAALAADLDPLLAAARPLPGPFSVPAEPDGEPPQLTEAWLHRFSDPEAWL